MYFFCVGFTELQDHGLQFTAWRSQIKYRLDDCWRSDIHHGMWSDFLLFTGVIIISIIANHSVQVNDIGKLVP